MVERIYETPPGVRLCAIDTIGDGKARNFVLEIKGAHFFGFIVRTGERIAGYVDLCPHMQVPLTQKLDDYLTPDGNFIHCVWHGALFEVGDGRCISGPCYGQKLRPWPVELQGRDIVTT